MNILFIDNNYIEINNTLKRYIYNKIGIYLLKYDNKMFLNFNPKTLKYRVLSFLLKNIYKNKKVYVVFSRYIKKEDNILKIINNSIKDNIIVTEQNNLYNNDVKYIENYIKRKKLDKRTLSILFVIDNIKDKVIKEKLNRFLQQYKTVDILLTNTKNYSFLKEYIEKINKEEGTTIEILDKMSKRQYNILLVFSHIHKEYYNNSSFILDYNDSDLDIASNTYLIYEKNKDKLKAIFNKLNMDISRFEKTKLGKLYIHVSR